MRTLLALFAVASTTLIAQADTDYEWQAKAAAAAINLRYQSPPTVTQTNPSPWIITQGVNNQPPELVAPTPRSVVRVQQATQPRVVTVTRPFAAPDTVLGAVLADPNNCPPEG